jgi:carbonic anhydrase
MKFDNFKRISIHAVLLLALIEIIYCTETRTHTHAKTRTHAKSKSLAKRSESMMEYLNNFFSDSSEEKLANFRNGNNERKLIKRGRGRSINRDENLDWENKNFEKNSELSRFSQKARSQESVYDYSKLAGRLRDEPAAAKTPAALAEAPTSSGVVSTPSRADPPTAESAGSSNATATDEMLQDWFQISSESFKSQERFPAVKLLDDTLKEIETDSNFFRINSAFDKMQGEDKPPGNKFFWFRLSGLHLYYSSTKSDINVLGAISIGYINNVEQFEGTPFGSNITYCMSIDDVEHTKWKVCGLNKNTTNIWSCRIKNYLHIDDPNCYPDVSNATTIIEKQVIQPIIIIPLPSRECNEGWDYQQNGNNWECDCLGKEQAPIDLPHTQDALDTPIKPLFQYEEIIIRKDEKDDKGKTKEPLKLVLDDNILKIKYDKFGKLVTMDGAVYFAQEIQIHTPAEHTVAGKTYEMEIQILHRGMSKGDLAKSAILCFLVEKVPGVYNKFMDDLDFFNLPNQLSKERELEASIFIPKLLYQADDDIVGAMKPFSFYTYQGSLTAPPCLENTIVYVASEPIQLGSTALKLFQEAIRIPDLINQTGDIILSENLPVSNRSPQPLNGRPVFFYDHIKNCGPDPVKPPKERKGHFEKIQKPITNYFYVNGQDPSGLPGSFVVSENEAQGVKITDPNYEGPRY